MGAPLLFGTEHLSRPNGQLFNITNLSAAARCSHRASTRRVILEGVPLHMARKFLEPKRAQGDQRFRFDWKLLTDVPVNSKAAVIEKGMRCGWKIGTYHKS
jgi:hypothetical protein